MQLLPSGNDVDTRHGPADAVLLGRPGVSGESELLCLSGLVGKAGMSICVTKENLSTTRWVWRMGLPVCSPLWGEILKSMVALLLLSPLLFLENYCMDDGEIVDVMEQDAKRSVYCIWVAWVWGTSNSRVFLGPKGPSEITVWYGLHWLNFPLPEGTLGFEAAIAPLGGDIFKRGSHWQGVCSS